MRRWLCRNGHAFWAFADLDNEHPPCGICRAPGVVSVAVIPVPSREQIKLDFTMEHYQALRNHTLPKSKRETKELREQRDRMAATVVELKEILDEVYDTYEPDPETAERIDEAQKYARAPVVAVRDRETQ